MSSASKVACALSFKALEAMDVIAAVASVASILSLLGESLNGTKKLRDFFLDVSSASTTITSFLGDIDSLLQAMQSIRELLEKLPEDSMKDQIVSLRIQLQNYTQAVSRWLATAKALRPACDKAMKAWFKKSWVALNIKSINKMRTELDRYRQVFALKLSILGR